MQPENRYTWNAQDYAAHSSAQQAWAIELISKLQLNGNESVLDIGCGDGKITAEIANQLPDGTVVGVDSSTEMIELAHKKFVNPLHPNLSFDVVDAVQLPFREQFDIVFSNAALHWIKDHQPVIAGIKNSLKRGGRMLLQMGGKGNAEAIISILENMTAEKKWCHYFADFEFPYGFHDSDIYACWLKEANLNPVRVELIPKDMSYKDKVGLTGWIRTTWLPYTDRVPTHRRAEFITQLVDRYVEKFPFDSQGKVHVRMIRLEAEAIKNT